MRLLFKDKHKALPYEWYFIPVLLLTLAGTANSLYLALTHYRNYTDLTWSSFCAISNAINCDTVAQSTWSIFWGIPVAFWGVLGYSLFSVLLLVVRSKSSDTTSIWSLLLLLSAIFSASSLLLGYISATRINSYCILCLLSYLISFSLLLYCWITWRRFGEESYIQGLLSALDQIRKNAFTVAGITTLIGAFILLKLFMPHYWLYEASGDFSNFSKGVTKEGHPWIGADNPEIIIEEFTDYQCFQCYKTHFALRRIIEQHPGKIKLVHRHYPLDHEFNPIAAPEPFHVGSGKLALLGIAASRQGKFWEVNDLLFKKIGDKVKTFDFGEIAAAVGADFEQLQKDYTSPQTLKQLEQDIRAGLSNNISSTPAFIVGGHTFVGTIPEKVLTKSIDNK